jgi:hypothetical protein
MKKKQRYSKHSSRKKTKQNRQQSSFYPSHVISMIYNPLNMQKKNAGQSDTDIFPFTVPENLAYNREFIKTLTKIQAKKLAIYYPDNFYLHLTKNVLHMKKLLGHPDVVPLPQITRLLCQHDTRLIAWCWYFTVHWVFLTDTMLDHCASEISDENGLMIKGHDGRSVPVSAGITFDDAVEGLFLVENNEIQVLFNPLYFDSEWMLADIIDLAVHECTHAIVFGHNEDFVLVESLLRRELRRIVEEESILEDARDMLDAIDYPIE